MTTKPRPVPVVPDANARADWQCLRDEVHSFGQFLPGWDGYAAEPPGEGAIRNVQEFLGVLHAAELLPDRVKPSVVGGIGVTFRRNARKAYVEFYNDGRVHRLFSDGVSDPDTRSVAPDELGYVSVIDDIKGFLNA